MGTDQPRHQDPLRDHDERQDHEVANLRRAVESRDVIGQAKGILMERHGIDADEAFQRLVRASQETNTKLHDIAAGIAEAQGGDARQTDRRAEPGSR